jgi:hypothetical protein
MSGLFQLFRSRVGVAIVGAILVGGLGAVFGIGSIWHPILPIAGGIVQGDATATTATTAAQATVTPEVTATPAATATTIPTVGPIATATPFPVGSTIHGSVVSIGANSFVISRNGVHYTILVDGATTYTGTATQFSGTSGIQNGYRVTATVAAQDGPTTYLASKISSSPPDN